MDNLFARPLLLDGATGTELQRRGMPEGVCTEQWILEHPEELSDLQRAYVDAGTMALTAPTFGASSAALGRFELEVEAEEINRALAELSIEAADGRAMVAGNLAPCGMILSPESEMLFEEIVDNYKAQVRGLKEAGVDFYLCETMTALAEARAAVLAVRETDPGKPLLVSFYCDKEGRLPDGANLLAALLIMQGMGVDGFGINCAEPGVILAQLERLAPHAEVPLLAMPGFGRQPVFEELGSWVEKFAALGVRAFGGCCGTGPRHIAALKRALDKLKLPPFTPAGRRDYLPCAGGREAGLLPRDTETEDILECTEHLGEALAAAEQKGFVPEVALLDESDLPIFAAAQFALRGPLCLWSDRPELLEAGLRIYQGRALADPNTDFDESFLQSLKDKYGLVLA